MATLSVDGLVSGLNTSSLIAQLLQAEAAPQVLLRTKLSATQADAAAYRSVNTRIDAVRTAAEAVLKADTWTAKKATSTSSGLTVTAGTSASPGSLTFDVKNTATAHTVIGAATYGATTHSAGFTELEVLDAAGAVKGKITIGGSGTLVDAVKSINDSAFGLSATAVQVSPGKYKLQVTAEQTGAAAAFDLRNPANLALLSPPDDFTTVTQGVNAKITVGSTTPYEVVSATNTFTDVMAGVTFTVSKPETGVTITVGNDSEVATGKVKSLVDALNSALDSIDSFTDKDGGTAAVLKGDSELRGITSRLLTAVSSAVGSDGSPADVGLQLTREGRVTFDAAKFKKSLETDPALAERLISGTDGVGRRLLDVSNRAADTTTGSLVVLAKGRDELAADLKTRIAD
ncbi:MAG: flagellar filament capping protein FliD, partial [Actinomycetota bacterium]|nr:flagellar filament capping protein FliD [Actinomycetota bacterium]